MTASRRLAAILAADVAGYSLLIGADEEGTLDRLRTIRADIIENASRRAAMLTPSPKMSRSSTSPWWMPMRNDAVVGREPGVTLL